MADDGALSSAVDSRERAVQNKVNSGNTRDALVDALYDPPVAAKDQSIKDRNRDIVLRVLEAVRDSDIDGHCSGLDQDGQDTLMKYIYRGLEKGENSASLLKWHAGCTKHGGLGCIVRALAERKTV